MVLVLSASDLEIELSQVKGRRVLLDVSGISRVMGKRTFLAGAGPGLRRFALICLISLITAQLFPLQAIAVSEMPSGDRCADGPLNRAAAEVFAPGTEVVARHTIAGLDGALVLEPRIAPGTRGRLLRVGSAWCEASSSFNLAWTSTGRSFDPTAREAAARAYARLAAAPYFDGITVTGVRELGQSTYGLTTHALTNGVEADWVIAIDADGVRTAKWTTTAFAQQPFRAETEGLTALPGGTESYNRVGVLLVATRGLPTARKVREAAAPGLAEYVGPDDFVIAVSVGNSGVAIDPDMDTGVRKADIVRENLRAIEVNYEEFYKWGMQKGWGPASGAQKGYVYINDATSLYCFACVFISNDFQIHLLSEVELVLNLLGYSYPEGVEAYQTILGHEMFHNFQNRYNKPEPGREQSFAFMEGTARAQETMHPYSKVSFQEKSLIYAQNGNGCNGFDGANFDASLAGGIFSSGTYSMCYFWLPWISSEGIDGLKRLVAKAYPAVSPEPNEPVEGVMALERASEFSVPAQVARFVGAAITGRGWTLGGHDWGKLMDRWDPPVLNTGDSAVASLSTGGLFARRLTSAAKVRLVGDAGATLFMVINTGSKTITRIISKSSACVAPKDGERIWVGAVRTREDTGDSTIVASKPSCP